MLNLVALGTQIDSFLRGASDKALILEPVTIRVKLTDFFILIINNNNLL